MDHTGYSWTIRPLAEGWIWSLNARDSGQMLVEGLAPSRAVAAAMVVRAIARGVLATTAVESLAA